MELFWKNTQAEIEEAERQEITPIVFAGSAIGFHLVMRNTGGHVMNAVHDLPNGDAIHITKNGVCHYDQNGDIWEEVFWNESGFFKPETLARIAQDYIASL